MRTLAAIFGCGLLLLVLSDCLNTVVVPRRTPHVLPIARAFYRLSWRPFSAIARRIASGERREAFLSIYGPVSFLGLLALWIAGLIVGFGLLQWAAGMRPDRIPGTLMNDIYFSAATLITLTTGDPLNAGSKFLAVVEGGLGLCLLGMVVAYLPVLYQSFSTRERGISLLDARAGSPPSAGTLLSSATCSPGKLEQEFVEWEKWEAQIFESQLSFPMLAYFRSHHSNQSWLTVLVVILDTASILVLCAEDEDLKRQAELTFAMGRHALADLADGFTPNPPSSAPNRLPQDQFARLNQVIRGSRAPIAVHKLSLQDLSHLRGMYEPLAAALSEHLMMALPSWVSSDNRRDNWRNIEPLPDSYAVSDPFRE